MKGTKRPKNQDRRAHSERQIQMQVRSPPDQAAQGTRASTVDDSTCRMKRPEAWPAIHAAPAPRPDRHTRALDWDRSRSPRSREAALPTHPSRARAAHHAARRSRGNSTTQMPVRWKGSPASGSPGRVPNSAMKATRPQTAQTGSRVEGIGGVRSLKKPQTGWEWATRNHVPPPRRTSCQGRQALRCPVAVRAAAPGVDRPREVPQAQPDARVVARRHGRARCPLLGETAGESLPL